MALKISPEIIIVIIITLIIKINTSFKTFSTKMHIVYLLVTAAQLSELRLGVVVMKKKRTSYGHINADNIPTVRKLKVRGHAFTRIAA